MSPLERWTGASDGPTLPIDPSRRPASPRPHRRSSGRTSNRTLLFALVLAIAAVMLASSLAASGAPLQLEGGGPLSSHGATGASASSRASSGISTAALTVSGPLVSLGYAYETGPAIGGSLSSLAVPLGETTSIVVTLPLQNTTELAWFVQSISDPNSPSYASFLTNSQFTARYGPPASAQQAISSWLQSSGLSVQYQSPDHRTIIASGSLAEIGLTFNVTFEMYAKGTQVFYAPTSAPMAPSSLAPWFLSVVGLTDYSYGARLQTTSTQTPGFGVLDYPNEMYYEFQLNQLFNATGNATAGVVPTYAYGVNITQALWSGEPTQCAFSYSDIQGYFDNHTGYPSMFPSPSEYAYYNISGYPGNPPGYGACSTAGENLTDAVTTLPSDARGELTLDQEYSGTTAPGANLNPVWVNGTSIEETNAPLIALTNWIAAGNVPNLSVLTQSYGGGETGFPPSATSYFETYTQDYQELAATGVSVLASSGDSSGAEGNAGNVTAGSPAVACSDQGTPGISFPASDPYALSVGGTANNALGGDILPGQTVWNWCPSADAGLSAGSTGGASYAFGEPWYQAGSSLVNRAMDWAINVTVTGNFTNGAPPNGCEGCNDGAVYNLSSARITPDLSGPAAQMAAYFDQQWTTNNGGTSFSSPSIAGMIASIVAFDGHKIGLFNPALYTLEEEYLSGQLSHLPFPVAPTYFVENYSNAFFNGGTDFNASAGWGVPQAYNIALLLGKPFLSTNPDGPAHVGTAYPIVTGIKDDRPVTAVQVAYLEPGATAWENASLALAEGSGLSGTWSGAIPAPGAAGTLRYCVHAIDSGQGNSWTPYNQSAWAATRGKDPGFGCTVPFSVTVQPGPGATYGLSFSETGLPAGTPWSVTVPPYFLQTTEASVTALVPNGTYAFGIGSVPGYYADPSGGTVSVAGTPVDVAISFAPGTPPPPPSQFSVVFTESGLSSGTSWTVSLYRQSLASTGGSIAFSETNGTYAYTVGEIPGYTARPGSGNVTVAGSAMNVAIIFSANAVPTATSVELYAQNVSPIANQALSAQQLPVFPLTTAFPTGAGAQDFNNFYTPASEPWRFTTAPLSSELSLVPGQPIVADFFFSLAPVDVFLNQSGVIPVTVSVTLYENGQTAIGSGSETQNMTWVSGTGGSNYVQEFEVGFLPSVSTVPVGDNLTMTMTVYEVTDALQGGVAIAYHSGGQYPIGMILPVKEPIQVGPLVISPSQTQVRSAISDPFGAADLASVVALLNSFELSDPAISPPLSGAGPWTYTWALPSGDLLSGTNTLEVATQDLQGYSSFASASFVYGYVVTFQEIGLPAGIGWSVSLGGSLSTAVSPSPINLSLSDGSYSFVVRSSNTTWRPLPTPGSLGASGTVNVDGQTVTVQVPFFEVVNEVLFTETGLAAGTSWSVVVGTSVESSTTPQVPYSEPNGTYVFSVLPVPGYSVSPRAGTVVVAGAPVTEPIAFSATTFTASFTETGLPHGATWYVNLTDGPSGFALPEGRSATAGTPITFSLVEGSYTFRVGTTYANYYAYPGVGRTATLTAGDPSVVIGFSYTDLGPGVNLRNQNLQELDLYQADLAGDNLQHANLAGDYMAYANLEGANLNGADLSYTNLSHANLQDANLHNADLAYSNLSYADLQGANIDGADFQGADTQGTKF